MSRRSRTFRTVLIAGVVVGMLGACGGDAAEQSSGCFAELAAHAPGEVSAPLSGGNLAMARTAGYDDTGGMEGVAQAVVSTGVEPDPLTWISVLQLGTLDDLGYAPTDIECWIGRSSEFAAVGSFDEAALDASRIATHAATDGTILVATADPADVSPGLDGSGEVAAITGRVLAHVEAAELVSFRTMPLTGEPVAVSGLAVDEGVRHLVLVWAFATDDAAEAGRDDLAGVLADTSAVGALLAVDPVDALTRSGSTVVLRAPLAADGDPSDWMVPSIVLDPAFVYQVGD